MEPNYWASTLRGRITRRRALAATGAVAAGAALLAACGGDDGGTAGKASGFLTPAEDTSKQAKRGGINKWSVKAEPNTFDVHIGGGPMGPFKDHISSKLVQEQPGYLAPPEFQDVAPDLAESWEVSADLLQITFKIRQNVKWHNIAPVSGRALDIQDLLFTWDRFSRIGRSRTAFNNALHPDAPILSMTAPDARTLVVKLVRPTSYLLSLFGTTNTGVFIVVPKETDSTYDIRQTLIGTGPFMLDKFEPSVGATWKRHPEFYDKDRPYVDQVDVPFMVEYATGLSQFKAGNIYTYDELRPEDLLITKRDIPALNMYDKGILHATGGGSILFGWLQPGQSPFRDERVRQAVSMSIDRGAYLDTFSNASELQAAGLPVETYWASVLGADAGTYWWLDPQSKDFGPNAKYYQHNLAEAKSLLSAAGYPNGLDIVSHFGDVFGRREAEVLDGMALEAGFRTKREFMDSAVEYPKFRDGNGKWENGWAYAASGPLSPHPVSTLTSRYTTGGGPGYLGFDVNGRGDGSGDPAVEDMIKKANLETSTEKRQALIFDIQRYLAKAMYSVRDPGVYTSFRMAWPALRNVGVFTGNSRAYNQEWWLDPTQAPLNRA